MWVGSWYPTSAWESPAADLSINGEIFRWRATDEMVIPGLNIGDAVNLRAFARSNGNLYRVKVTKADK